MISKVIEIETIGAVKTVSDKLEVLDIVAIEKRTDGSNWDNYFKFQAKNDMAHAMSKLKPGSVLQVTFVIDGRKWKDTVIMNLNIARYTVINENRGYVDQSTKAKDIPSPGPWDNAGSAGPSIPNMDEIEYSGDLPF